MRAAVSLDSTGAGGCKGEYRQKTLPVKSFSPNSWGLYQMHGNVWKWCQDVYRSYPITAINEPQPLLAGIGDDDLDCVFRGGSWGSQPAWLRSAHRDKWVRLEGYADIGFRRVISII